LYTNLISQAGYFNKYLIYRKFSPKTNQLEDEAPLKIHTIPHDLCALQHQIAKRQRFAVADPPGKHPARLIFATSREYRVGAPIVTGPSPARKQIRHDPDPIWP